MPIPLGPGGRNETGQGPSSGQAVIMVEAAMAARLLGMALSSQRQVLQV